MLGKHPRKTDTSSAPAKRMSGRIGVSLLTAAGLIVLLGVAADYWRSNSTHVTVEVRGNSLVSVAEVLRAAAVPDTAVLADVPLMEIRRRVEGLHAVREAAVRRDPPSTLVIELREREPIAVLANVNAEDWLVDADGVLLPVAGKAQMLCLPLISGAASLKNAASGRRVEDSRLRQALGILAGLKKCGSDYLNLFSEISLEGKSDFLLYTLSGGVPVLLRGGHDIRRAAVSFKTWWEQVAVPRDIEELESVALRYRDQVVAKCKGATTAAVTIDTTAILQD